MKMDFVLSTTTEHAMNLALKEAINKSKQDSFQEIIVIAPETKTIQIERFLLENTQNHAFSSIYVYSFNRLLKRLQTKQIHPLSKEAGVMIVRKLIMANQESLVCYKKTAGTIGFAENIYETIQQLKSSGISPIELLESSKKCTTALKIKLDDIALIYDAYENYLGEELTDPSDKLTMLENKVIVSDRIKNACIFVVGFDSLTTSACSVIKSLVKQAKSVCVSACYIDNKQKNAHIADNEVYEKLKHIADSLKIKYEPKFKEKPLYQDFKHLKKNLFAYPQEKTKTCGNLKLFGAPNADVEAKKIASLIKKDILENKFRYKDNSIYLADELMLDVLKTALNEYEIPFYSANPYKFENHQLFVFIKQLFLLVRKNLDQEDVINFAKCALLEIDYNKTDDFENYVLKYGINHNKFLKPFTYHDNEERLKNSEYVRQEIEKVVREFLAVYKENITIEDFVQALFSFFEKIDIESRLERLGVKQEEQGALRDALATKQALKRAKEVLEMLKQFLGEEQVKLDEFYVLLISGLEAVDISLLPQSLDCVQVTSKIDLVYGIKNLYVMGASEGLFPKREQDLGLIQDGEISSLEGVSEKKIEPTIKTVNRRERFKIYELLQVPTNKLTISFSERAINGEEVKFSSLMQSIASLFVNDDGSDFLIEKVSNPYEENGKNLVLSLGTKNNALKYLAKSVANYKAGIDYSLGVDVINNLYGALKPCFELDIENKFKKINEKEEFVNLKNAKKLFFKKKTTSISQLEKYFNCPFQHFLAYGLRLKDREKASMRALDVGDILHEVAEKFVNLAQKTKDINIEKVSTNLLKGVLSNEKYSEEENRILVKILEGEAVRLCNALFNEMQVSCFKPVATEKWFGDKGDYKGVLLNKKHNVELVGKIDRIDESDKFYRIIDYKTGKIDSRAEDIYYGKKLQLALYLSAVKNKNKEPAGVLYFPIKNEYADSKSKASEVYRMKGFILSDKNAILDMDKTLSHENPRSKFIYPEIKTSNKNDVEFKANNQLLTKEETESMASYAVAVAGKAIDEILDGNVEPSPYKSLGQLPCEYCEYRKVCGIISNDYKSVREPNNLNAKDFYKGGTIWQN